MTWGIELWDQWKEVQVYTKNGLRGSSRVADFLRERAALEADYAKSVKKLVKDTLAAEDQRRSQKDSFEFHEQPTLVSGYLGLLKETEDMAAQHQETSSKLIEIAESIRAYSKQATQQRKQLVEEGDRHIEELNKGLKELETAEKNLQKAKRDHETLQGTLEKAEKDLQKMKAEELEALREQLRSKGQRQAESEERLQQERLSFQALQKKHYEVDMAAVLEGLERSEGQRVEQLARAFMQYHGAHASVQPFVAACLEHMAQAVQRIKPELDSAIFVREHRTGHPLPTTVHEKNSQSSGQEAAAAQLGEGLSGETSKRSSRAGTLKRNKSLFKKSKHNKDYSDLPPEQQRRRLAAVIDKNEAQLGQLRTEKEALDKLAASYQANPSFGDKKAREKNFKAIEEAITRIELVQAKLSTYRAYLDRAAATSSSPSPSPSPAEYLAEVGQEPLAGDGQDTSDFFSSSGSNDVVASSQSTWSSGCILVGQDSQEPQSRPDSGYLSCEGGDSSPGSKAEKRATALFDYDALTGEELSFKQGDALTVLEQGEDGWWKAQLGGREGLVPHNYFSELQG